MVWFKWVANAHRDAEISALTDTQFRAFITIIGEVKLLRSGGIFKNRQHLKACIGSRYGKAIDGIVAKGLMSTDQAGVVTIIDWHRYQVDPTSNKRQAAYIARRRVGANALAGSR